MTAAYASDAAVLAEGVLVVRRREPMKHPVAHRDGIALLGQMISASYAWDAMSSRQRQLVQDTCRPLFAAVREDGQQVEPPALAYPPPTTTLRSLRRKQLVEPDTLQLTALAVLAARYGPIQAAERRGYRAVETVTTSEAL